MHLRGPPPKPVWKNPDEAFVFMLTNDSPMHLIWALEGSLRNVSSTRRRIALVTPKVSAPMRDVLTKLHIEVQEVPQLTHPNFRTTFARWRDTLAKFAIFELKNLTKFVYMDADIIVNSNIDDYFELDTNRRIHGMLDKPECESTNTGINAGLLVASPNTTMKTSLLAMLEERENPTKEGGGDQEILNRYLVRHGMLRTRPETDMAFLWRCGCVVEKKVPYYDYTVRRTFVPSNSASGSFLPNDQTYCNETSF